MESDGDERKAEDLAVDMRDLENEPRQAIVVASVGFGENARVLPGFLKLILEIVADVWRE